MMVISIPCSFVSSQFCQFSSNQSDLSDISRKHRHRVHHELVHMKPAASINLLFLRKEASLIGQ